MENFVARGRTSTGDVDYDYGIRDLEVYVSGSNIAVYASSGSYGGMTGYRINGSGNLTQTDTMNYNPTNSAGLATDMTLVDTGSGMRMLVGGLGNGRVMSYAVTTNGQISNGQIMSGVNANMGVIGTGVQSDDTVILANPWDEGFSVYDLNGQQLNRYDIVSDTGNSYGYAIRDMVVLERGGKDFVLTAANGSQSNGWSLSEVGITSYELTNGGAQRRDALGADKGLGFMIPTDMTMVQVGGQQFAIMASASGNEGSLSVVGITASGTLSLTDHVGDTRFTRFGAAQAVEAISVGGRAYVVAGGGDDGLTLFAVTEGGRLVLLDSIADTNQTGLSGITAIELAASGDTLHVFAASQSDAGVTHLTVDLGDVGQSRGSNSNSITGSSDDDLLEGGNGNNNINGNGGDDVLVDGAGNDTLRGSAGNDIFVLVADDDDDRISDFNVNQDKIDLSGWAHFHSADALSLSRITGGVRINWRDEELDVMSGAWMSYDNLRGAIVNGTSRVFETPMMDLSGTAAADILTGEWAADTLDGAGGDDILRGAEGGDLLRGGSGNDTVNGGSDVDRAIMDVSQRDVTDVEDMGAGRVLVTSAQGIDTYISVEEFEFNDAVLSLQEVINLDRGLTLTGNGQGNSINGSSGHDTIRGEGGNDTLTGRDGDDVLDGGDGDDQIIGGGGLDRAVMGFSVSENFVVHVLENGSIQVISNHGTDAFSGVERFEFSDGVWTRDQMENRATGRIIEGGAGNDLLRGSAGNDLIIGGGGVDTLEGVGGNDVLRGRKGRDLIEGGGGNDTLEGGTGDDTLFGGSGVDRAVVDCNLNQVRVRMLDRNRLEIRSPDGTDVFEGIEWFAFDNAYLRWKQVVALQKSPAYFGSGGSDKMEGNNKANTMLGYAGSDRLSGMGGNDLINGGGGRDTLNGAKGNDTIEGGTGNDIMYGEKGRDLAVLNVRWANTKVRDMGKGWVQVTSADGVDRFHKFEKFQFSDRTITLKQLLTERPGIVRNGTEGRDTLRGTAGDDTLIGEGGNDLLSGDKGADVLRGGEGNDRINGGSDDDRMAGAAGDDKMAGGAGRDRIEGDGGDDTLEGGSGTDTLEGGSDNDLLRGDGGSDRLSGNGGRDILRGGDENDTLSGGSGDDQLYGNDGNDRLVSQAGEDQLYGNAGRDVLVGGGGDDVLLGDVGNDTLSGGSGNDTLRGGFHDDRLVGNGGDDLAYGGNGRDVLVGGAGNDTLSGDKDRDTITGGEGDDILSGGQAGDTFIFYRGDGHDVITDFNIEFDQLSLKGNLVGGAQNGREVLQTYGEITQDGLVLDFNNGSTVTLEGVEKLYDLLGNIDIF